MIFEKGEEINTQSKAGRKKILLSIMPAHSYFIGVELFETYLTFCLTDNLGTIIFTKEIQEDKQVSTTTSSLLKHLNDFINQSKEYNPLAVGIAIPGHYNPKSKFIMTNNPFWKFFDLNIIIENISLPVYFENNVITMTLAERLFGEDSKDRNFLFLHLRRGMFSSYMYESKIYARDNYTVGEIGHTVINPLGELCECGKHGCLQTYASQTWMIRKAKVMFQNISDSRLRQLVDHKDDIDIYTIVTAYQLGDEAVINLVNTAMKYFSIAINNLLLAMDTDIIYIHGEIFDNDSIKNLLIQNLEDNVAIIKTEKTTERIFKPYFKFNGAIGAAALCITETLTKFE